MNIVLKTIGKKLYFIPEVLFSFILCIYILNMVGAFKLLIPITATIFNIPNYVIFFVLIIFLFLPIFYFVKYVFNDIAEDKYYINDTICFIVKLVSFLTIAVVFNLHLLFALYIIGLYFYLEDKYV